MSASQNVTIADALASMKLVNDTTNVQTYNLAGQVPTSLIGHAVDKDYIITGITPADFIKTHGAAEFDLMDMKEKFKTICHDYGDELRPDEPSKACEFCSKLIYEIGPQSRQGVKTSDKLWKMRFMYKNASGVLEVATLFVATYRGSNYESQYAAGVRMCLTIKQAGLLAMDTFDRVTIMAYNQAVPIRLLTPLAGSIFSRDDISKMAQELGTTDDAVLVAINNSCQSGGQYLANSSINIAAVASIVATRNIKDKPTMEAIVGKTIRQYLVQKKKFDETKFEVYCAYAHGGVPSEMSVDILVSKFSKLSDAATRKALQAVGQTTASSTVSALQTDAAQQVGYTLPSKPATSTGKTGTIPRNK